MTAVTLSTLKTTLARALRDPSLQTFDTNDLGDFINAGIMEVSRLAPQRFVEDVDFGEGQVRYALRGGTGNMLSNWSFEEGDATVLAGRTEVTADDPDGLLSGWKPNVDLHVSFPKSSNAKAGSRVLKMSPAYGLYNTYVYQDVPVDADVTYSFSGYHWKATAGGASCRMAVQTLDSDGLVVRTVYSWTTTANKPVLRTGSIVVASSGEAYIRVYFMHVGESHPADGRDMYVDAVKVYESDEATLVSLQSVNDIEVSRVEKWYYDDDEAKFYCVIPSASSQPEMSSGSGWTFWAGDLYIPDRVVAAADTSRDFMRVFGYAPYDRLTSAGQTSDLTDELQFAVIAYARLEALRTLLAERELYTQWQTRSGNSDVSPAGLMNALNIAQNEWRQRSRALTRLRATV